MADWRVVVDEEVSSWKSVLSDVSRLSIRTIIILNRYQ